MEYECPRCGGLYAPGIHVCKGNEELSAQAWAEFGRWLFRYRVAHPDDEATDHDLIEVYARKPPP
jgi:hypothetical protein